MNELLRRMYRELLADMNRVKFYQDKKKDFEDVQQEDVLNRATSAHEIRIKAVKNMLTKGSIQTGDDYFHAAYILFHSDTLENMAMACMLARVAKERAFTGLNNITDIDEFIVLSDIWFTHYCLRSVKKP